MIGMLVSDQDRSQRLWRDAKRAEPLEGFLARKAGIDEEASPLGRDQSGVA